jgi:hypothetical protein
LLAERRSGLVRGLIRGAALAAAVVLACAGQAQAAPSATSLVLPALDGTKATVTALKPGSDHFCAPLGGYPAVPRGYSAAAGLIVKGHPKKVAGSSIPDFTFQDLYERVVVAPTTAKAAALFVAMRSAVFQCKHYPAVTSTAIPAYPEPGIQMSVGLVQTASASTSPVAGLPAQVRGYTYLVSLYQKGTAVVLVASTAGHTFPAPVPCPFATVCGNGKASVPAKSFAFSLTYHRYVNAAVARVH